MQYIGLSAWIVLWLHFFEMCHIASGQTPDITTRKAGTVIKYKIAEGIHIDFCWIPKGKSQLGSTILERKAVNELLELPEDTKNLDNESSENRGIYSTNGFWMSKYPITQAQWLALRVESKQNATFSSTGRFDRLVENIDTSMFPMENISWVEIQIYINKLSALNSTKEIFDTKVKFKLPHEDEWEYAYRANLSNKIPFYWGKSLNGQHANCNGKYPYGTTEKGPHVGKPTTVGSYSRISPHPWGLCDMSGNVDQLCDNLFEKKEGIRVTRGGSFASQAFTCRAASRGRLDQTSRSFDTGFRIVVLLDE